MVGDTMTRKYGNFSVYSPRKKDLKIDLQRVRDEIGDSIPYNNGKRYTYIPDLINETVDTDFYVALDMVRRFGSCVPQHRKHEVLNLLIDWYESKLKT